MRLQTVRRCPDHVERTNKKSWASDAYLPVYFCEMGGDRTDPRRDLRTGGAGLSLCRADGNKRAAGAFLADLAVAFCGIVDRGDLQTAPCRKR